MRQSFQSERLRFYGERGRCRRQARSTPSSSSSTLQYLDRPYETLDVDVLARLRLPKSFLTGRW